jgi:hypothetical protein
MQLATNMTNDFPKTLIVGGEENYARQFIGKALKRGIFLDMVEHRGWSSNNGKPFPQNIDLCIVLKDICNHKVRDWASSEAKKSGVKYCEISQKISHGILGLRRVLGIINEEPSHTEGVSVDDLIKQEIPVLSLLHEAILEAPSEVLIYKKTSLGSKKKYLNYIFKNAIKWMKENTEFEHMSSRYILDKAKDNPFQILSEIYKEVLTRKLKGYELLEESIREIAIYYRLEEIPVHEIKRLINFSFGYNLPSETAKSLENMVGDKIREEEYCRKLRDLILENPVVLLGYTDNDSDIYDNICEHVRVGEEEKEKVEREVFNSVMDEIRSLSQSRKKSEEKKRVFNSKNKWAEWFLVKREEGEIVFTNTGFSKIHKHTWGSRVNDDLRVLYLSDPKKKDVKKQEDSADSHFEMIEQLEIVPEPIQDLEHLKDLSEYLNSEPTEDDGEEEMNTHEDISENADVIPAVDIIEPDKSEEITICLGDFEMVLKGELRIKEVKAGTRISSNATNNISFESFDGESLKGIVIK